MKRKRVNGVFDMILAFVESHVDGGDKAPPSVLKPDLF